MTAATPEPRDRLAALLHESRIGCFATGYFESEVPCTPEAHAEDARLLEAAGVTLPATPASPPTWMARHLREAVSTARAQGRESVFLRHGDAERMADALEASTPESAEPSAPAGGLREAAEDALALLEAAYVDAHTPDEPDDTINALRSALAEAPPTPPDRDSGLRAALLADIVDEVRPAISNAYYDARNAGETMEDAASRAAGAVLAVIQDSPTMRGLLADGERPKSTWQHTAQEGRDTAPEARGRAERLRDGLRARGEWR